jgi:putative zinc finger/helix-turn-helix YgiT family protein
MDCHTGDHHYIESGLDNIHLEGIEHWQCKCGETAVGIPAIPKLHSLIGEHLILKKDMLTGKEIRFLRKNMGYKAKRLAGLLGVDKATVSRWENNKRPPDPTTERLIRLLYAFSKALPQKTISKIVDGFPQISRKQEPASLFKIPSWRKDQKGSQGSCAK